MITVGMAVVNVAANVWMIPRYGILGAAGVSFACQSIKAILIWRIGQRVYPIAWQYRQLAAIFVGLAAAYAFGRWFDQFGWTTATIAQSVVVLLTPLVLVLLGSLDADERLRVTSWIGRHWRWKVS